MLVWGHIVAGGATEIEIIGGIGRPFLDHQIIRQEMDHGLGEVAPQDLEFLLFHQIGNEPRSLARFEGVAQITETDHRGDGKDRDNGHHHQ